MDLDGRKPGAGRVELNIELILPTMLDFSAHPSIDRLVVPLDQRSVDRHPLDP